MTFNEWLDTFLKEKKINLDEVIEVEGQGGMNFIPVSSVVNYIKSASDTHQERIKDVLVKIDFKNGDVMRFIKDIGWAIAV